MKKRRVLLLGAAGRDYDNFLVYFKENPTYEVVGFTQAQIPGIEKRFFPKQLAGKLYKKDIPFYREEDLEILIKKLKVDDVVLSYSDLSHQDVMMKASRTLSAGANFVLLGPRETQIVSRKPVISITAVRTGAGKSQTSRKVAQILKEKGYRVIAIRHPMPYGVLKEQVVERFAAFDDLKRHKCTIEEQEEYTPWIELGIPVYAGVDYEKIIRAAEKEADIIIWDGGNNDYSFYRPDLSIVVVDPHRAGHELTYYPGMVNFLTAEIIVINKMDTARAQDVALLEEHIKQYNPRATVVYADSPLTIDQPKLIKNKRVIVVEDGPTLTHGGMTFGAGMVAARQGQGTVVDAQPYAVGSLKELYLKFPHLKKLLPAMGYSSAQMKELQETINRIPADAVIDGSPFDMRRMLKVNKPIVNVRYTLKERGDITLRAVLDTFLRKRKR